MTSIDYSNISTNITLSCEWYTNNGATYELYEDVIESIKDDFIPYTKLRCSRSGINNNPIVTFMGPASINRISYILYVVENGIRNKLGLPNLEGCYDQ